MDNRINEARRKISALRAEIADAEASVRDLINRDLDCVGRALHQINLRKEMVRLVAEWKAAGGGDLALDRGNKLVRLASRR